MHALHVPAQQGVGMTPAFLRSGGATFWYHVTDSPDFVRFRGRWANLRMLQVYIQEVAASTFLNNQPEETREHIRAFAEAGPPLFAQRYELLG